MCICASISACTRTLLNLRIPRRRRCLWNRSKPVCCPSAYLGSSNSFVAFRRSSGKVNIIRIFPRPCSGFDLIFSKEEVATAECTGIETESEYLVVPCPTSCSQVHSSSTLSINHMPPEICRQRLIVPPSRCRIRKCSGGRGGSRRGFLHSGRMRWIWGTASPSCTRTSGQQS